MPARLHSSGRDAWCEIEMEPELARVRERLLGWLLNDDALPIWWSAPTTPAAASTRRSISPGSRCSASAARASRGPPVGLQRRLAWPDHRSSNEPGFSSAGRCARREDVRSIARRLYRFGAEHGIDPRRGVAIFALLDDPSVNDAKARPWSQTEWLKVALILARSASGKERRFCLSDTIAAAKALSPYLDRPVAGLWHDKLPPDGSRVDEPAPASSFCRIIDALRVPAAWPADRMLDDTACKRRKST
jgi:mannose/cellobiose epimerase-like protein (N-acyl-D-glucosamine 2-epimerase family)